jgi:S1-C subfamily serine protease
LSGEDLGTGLVLTSSGVVVTNNHVIDGATSIQVRTTGGSGVHRARVIGADTSNDLALLQLDGVVGLPTIIPSRSSPAVGDSVVAIGNALGLGGPPTVSNGTITALGRSIEASDPAGGTTEALSGLIQTDSPIQPGDSGGALVNSSGQVVGLITAAATGASSRSAADVGFAIPIANVTTIVNLIRSGQGSPSIVLGQPPFLGVAARDLDPPSAAHLGLHVGVGVLVLGVVPHSPGSSLGLSGGDVIVAVDGQRIDSVTALQEQIRAHHPGQSLQVSWVAGNGPHSGSVTLVAGPAV